MSLRHRTYAGSRSIARWDPSRPACLSISAFPVELLIEVFADVVLAISVPSGLTWLTCNDPLNPWPYVVPAARRDVLMSVCKVWREIVLATPLLWTAVDVGPNSSLERLDSALKRAWPHRVAITVNLLAPTRPHTHLLPLALGVAEQSELLSFVFRRLASSETRWSKLAIHAQEHSVIDTFLELLERRARPSLLHTFEIICAAEEVKNAGNVHRQRSTFPPPLLTPRATGKEGLVSRACLLSSITLRGCRVDWGRVSAVISPALTQLTLDHIMDRLPLDRLLAIIKLCSSLESLRIGGAFMARDDIASDGDAHARVVLPVLQNISLASVPPPETAALLDRLETPVLRALSFDLPFHVVSVAAADYRAIVESLPSAYAGIPFEAVITLSLRALGLSYPVSVPGIQQLFCSMHALTYLFMDFRTLQVEFWLALLATVATPNALPTLKHLTVAGMSPLDVQEFILLRQQRGLPKLYVTMYCKCGWSGLEDERKWTGWLQVNTLSCTMYAL
ncbi:hypothetical protein OH76DRAFT_1416676 [Lentinus brumalis]|uniref:F-box domain-containing protein n=1 Tax=Lentinus brumalis TaxID=2498619 RepID=A0A371DJ55_9APHY|nr:hypothetical protein OH76DRAFT_1416676 [Polyporus brumalis]